VDHVEKLGIDLEMPGVDLERLESGSCRGGNITKKLKVKMDVDGYCFSDAASSCCFAALPPSPHSHINVSLFFSPILAFAFGATGCLCLWRHVAHPFPI
jgi:hypothetical protein